MSKIETGYTLLERDPRRKRPGVRLILLTVEECQSCEDIKQSFKEHISKGDIEVRSTTDPNDDWATDLGTRIVDLGGTIPSLVVVDSEDRPMLSLTAEELGIIIRE